MSRNRSSPPALNSVTGYISIGSNDALLTLSSFSKLATVKGNIGISGNQKLACVKGLSGLTKVGGTVSISGNPKLAICNELYRKISSAAGGKMSKSNFHVKRDACNHACPVPVIPPRPTPCTINPFGAWSTCANTKCGAAYQFRMETVKVRRSLAFWRNVQHPCPQTHALPPPPHPTNP